MLFRSPEFGGVGGWARDKAGTWLPGTNTEAAEWWKNYRKDIQLQERYLLFGGTLTNNEQASWRSADIEPGMNPELIAKNLAIRADLAEKAYEKRRTQYGAGGHNVADAFPARNMPMRNVPKDKAGIPTMVPNFAPPAVDGFSIRVKPGQ